MTEHQHHITYQRFEDAGELPQEEQALLQQALDATEHAFAPYSGFRVGCALLLEDGEVIVGNNQENVAFPSGLCAERTAFFRAGSEGKGEKVRKVAIRALSSNYQLSSPPASCGACRQVMVEYERRAPAPFIVLMQGASGAVLRLEGVQQSLMPFTFDLDL